jgi:hypothetical protein
LNDLRGLLRDWIHETPLSQCNTGSDTCPDWELALALANAIEERGGPLAGLAWEQLMLVTRKVVEVTGETD